MISFFGASVTEQKTGYTYEFKKLLENNINVSVFGYGSTHLNDAGVCLIDNVIKETPNYCFIDWFSTGFVCFNSYIYTFLNTIVYKFSQINCYLIFLFFDRNPMEENRIKMYDIVKEYCKNHNIKYIELFNNKNVSELLRDTVHTNELGSKYYANKIYEFYNNEIVNKNNIMINIPEKNKYCDIKSIEINKIIKDKIIFKGNAEIIGILQIIGLNSGIIEINNNNVITKYNLWDQWCHYNRTNMKINLIFENFLEINITQEKFDTSLCKNNDINWDSYDKYMDIKQIFYIGELVIK